MTKKVDQFTKKAERLRAEINKLSDNLYNLAASDPHLRYLNLKTYRAELFRGFIVHLHLAIEDLLHALLFDFLVKQNRSLPTKEGVRIVRDMRSAELIQWCGRLKLITPKQYRSLLELNRIRNACAHRWILDIPKSRSVLARGLKKRIRVPVVIYNGKNLFNPKVFSNDFSPIFGGIYLRLLLRVWKIQGKL